MTKWTLAVATAWLSRTKKKIHENMLQPIWRRKAPIANQNGVESELQNDVEIDWNTTESWTRELENIQSLVATVLSFPELIIFIAKG